MTSVAVRAGQYQIYFHHESAARTGFDAAATHTIGIYSSRVLTVYNLGTNYASAVFNFVPNGAKVAKVHDLIRTASCNSCHDQLSGHGGVVGAGCRNVRALPSAAKCGHQHWGQTSNAKVIFHKLHMGLNLPSVKAGTPLLCRRRTPSEASISQPLRFRRIRAIRGAAWSAIRKRRAPPRRRYS